MLIDLSLKSPLFALIVEDSQSPYEWTNQTGGTACDHPSVRGVMIPWFPFTEPCITEILNDVWPGTVDINKINTVFDEYDVPLITIDRPDSAEAWLWVEIKESLNSTDSNLLLPFQGLQGVLVWENSD